MFTGQAYKFFFRFNFIPEQNYNFVSLRRLQRPTIIGASNMEMFSVRDRSSEGIQSFNHRLDILHNVIIYISSEKIYLCEKMQIEFKMFTVFCFLI